MDEAASEISGDTFEIQPQHVSRAGVDGGKGVSEISFKIDAQDKGIAHVIPAIQTEGLDVLIMHPGGFPKTLKHFSVGPHGLFREHLGAQLQLKLERTIRQNHIGEATVDAINRPGARIQNFGVWRRKLRHFVPA